MTHRKLAIAFTLICVTILVYSAAPTFQNNSEDNKDIAMAKAIRLLDSSDPTIRRKAIYTVSQYEYNLEVPRRWVKEYFLLSAKSEKDLGCMKEILHALAHYLTPTDSDTRILDLIEAATKASNDQSIRLDCYIILEQDIENDDAFNRLKRVITIETDINIRGAVYGSLYAAIPPTLPLSRARAHDILVNGMNTDLSQSLRDEIRQFFKISPVNSMHDDPGSN